ncbi:MAG TPA: FAD-binding oxidoreductase [Vicinamibacterales bacterium]|nr:FAD-binding oxidoreductase [Vicinamibacterales bacterium]
MLTLTLRDVLPATPRARIARIDLDRHSFEYAPGQAVMIASHGAEKRRPYSIASAPEDARRDGLVELLIGVNDDGVPGPHLTLESGALVDVDGPIGAFTFPPAPEETRFVFIAGGTGIAPLRAMLRHALYLPYRNIGLFYSARTPDEFAFEKEFRDLAAAGRIELRQTVTRAADDAGWDGARGRLDRGTLAELVHDPATLCFVCGPAPMVDEMPRVLEEIGIPKMRIRVEEW